MGDPPDLLVLGAGPAGQGAALSAAECGVRTLVVDEACRPDWLVPQSIATAFGSRVWSVSAGLRVDAVGPAGLVHWQPRAIVVATGATERVVPFPGWTAPAVIGLAEVDRAGPGARIVVAGCGELLASTALALLAAGRTIVSVLDLAAAPVPEPEWVQRLRAAGVRVLFGHGVRAVSHDSAGLQILVAAVDAGRGWLAGGTAWTLAADCLAIGHGLCPATEVTRLLRARHVFVRDDGGWVPACDADGRTSIRHLYVAGAAAGVVSAAAAGIQGRLAGLAVALDLGRVDEVALETLRRSLADIAPTASGALYPAQVAGIPPDTVVCRCEDVTRAQIEGAVAAGAGDMNQLRAFTRCGMGPCQGRFCADVAGELVAAVVGGREAAGSFTGRAPLRPIGLAELTGAYDYDDIPIPASAPL